jgi:hypothetical protein
MAQQPLLSWTPINAPLTASAAYSKAWDYTKAADRVTSPKTCRPWNTLLRETGSARRSHALPQLRAQAPCKPETPAQPGSLPDCDPVNLQGNRKFREAREKYSIHKGQAKARGILHLMSFEDWWAVWQGSGRWAQRGRYGPNYCLARINQDGPYSASNVAIITKAQASRQNRIARLPRITEGWQAYWAARKAAA